MGTWEPRVSMKRPAPIRRVVGYAANRKKPVAQSYIRMEPVMRKNTRFVGLDVHANTIAVAVADAGSTEVRFFGTIQNRFDHVQRLIKKLGGPDGLKACYEAGPTGYRLYRDLQKLGVECEVIAPTLVPVKAGDRIKTDRRDAEKLARNFRAGLLTKVYVPTPEHEAFRELVRAREAAKEDQKRARLRMRTFLLRHGLRPPQKTRAWSVKFMDWLNSLKFEHFAQNEAFVDLRSELQRLNERLTHLEAVMVEAVDTLPEAMREVIRALQALRGVGVIIAATIVAEVGTFSRFASPTELMAYTGIVPGEHSSGERTVRLGITKTGNARMRRVSVEAAWSYRYQPAVSEVIRRRQEGLPLPVKDIAWRAQQRLFKRLRQLVGRGKARQVAVTAVARELLGFVWEIGRHVEAELTASHAAA